VLTEPIIDVTGIKADELADLMERNSALGHQAPHEPFAGAQPIRQVAHAEERNGPWVATLSSTSPPLR